MLLSRRAESETSTPRAAGPGFRECGGDAACLTLDSECASLVFALRFLSRERPDSIEQADQYSHTGTKDGLQEVTMLITLRSSLFRLRMQFKLQPQS
jgi:hypothetical protein